MENSTLPEMALKTHNPTFTYTFKWEIESLSKIFSKIIDSPKFQVEPGSSWYVTLVKTAEKGHVDLWWGSIESGAQLHYVVKVSDDASNVLYQNADTIDRDAEDSNIELRTTVIDEFFKPENDRLIIEIRLKVIGLVTKNMSPIEPRPLTMKSVWDFALKADTTVNDESEAKRDHRASRITRSVFFTSMLSRMSPGGEQWGEKSWENFQANQTFMITELLKDVDFDTAADLYKVADQHSLTDVMKECKSILLSKVSPDNVQRILDVLKLES